MAALALQRAGYRLYGAWAGLWAAPIYSLMPGVQLGGDRHRRAAAGLPRPGAVWAYAVWWTSNSASERRRAAAALGAALGVAALAKHAAVYVMPGLSAARADVRRGLPPLAGRRASSPRRPTGPGPRPQRDLERPHSFATLSHTAQAADWNQPTEMAARRPPASTRARRRASSPAVLGCSVPLAFAIFLWAAGTVAWRRLSGALPALEAAADGLCSSLALPAAGHRAGRGRPGPGQRQLGQPPPMRRVRSWWPAGWCASRRRPAARCASAWRSARRSLTLAFLDLPGPPELADRAGFSNSLKRARGWSETARLTFERAAAEPGLSAAAADDRFLFNSLAYYGRAALARPGLPPLRMWVREKPCPLNECRGHRPADAGPGRLRVLRGRPSTYPDEAAAPPARPRPGAAPSTWRSTPPAAARPVRRRGLRAPAARSRHRPAAEAEARAPALIRRHSAVFPGPVRGSMNAAAELGAPTPVDEFHGPSGTRPGETETGWTPGAGRPAAPKRARPMAGPS